MMDNLRAASNHVVLKVILGLIILSFVLTGVGGYLTGGNGDYAAKVNGHEISRSQLDRAFSNERARQQQILGDQFSQLAGNEGYMQQLRQQALSQLIDEQLLDQYAKKIGLAISDEQVKQAIFSQPPFQTEGKFDNAKYLAILNSMGFTADRYAEALRKQLMTQQLVQAVAGSDFMLNGETDALAALVSQQRLVREATINVAGLAPKQTVTPEEIKSYYQQNAHSMMSPEQFRVSYILMDAANMQQTASENDIQSWYDQHQADYTQPEQRRYSIIQTNTDADASAVLDALKKGEDFAALAKTRSVDPITAKKGGDMGWLEPETTPDELKDAGLTQKGQLSAVIKSSTGFIVARLEDVKPQKIQALAEVHAAIADKVKQEKAIDAFYKLQQKVSEAASNDPESLASAEQVSGLKAVQTGWFTHDSVPAELNDKAVQEAIFNGGLAGDGDAPGRNSDIISVDGDRAFVLRISEHKPEVVKPLETVTAEISRTLQQSKAQSQAQQQAEKLLTALKAGNGEAVMKANGLSFGSQQTLERSGKGALTQAVFALPLPAAGKVTYGMGHDELGNVTLLALDKVQSGKLTDQQKQALVQGITQNNGQLSFEAMLSNLRKAAKIKFGAAAQAQ